jgi:alkylhydroperoxidase family enzyme
MAMTEHATLRFRYRLAQVAVLLALCVGGALVWNRRDEAAGHEQRLQQIDELLAKIKTQRDESSQLLRRAQAMLAAAEEYQATHKAADSEPAPPKPPTSP